MTLITDKPDTLPSDNALDRFRLDEPAAEIRLAGKILTVLEHPPSLGDEVTLMIRVRVTEICEAQREDDEIVHYRKTKLIGCWKPGEKPPADEAQAGLFDDGDEPQTVGEVIDEMAGADAE